MFLCAVLGSQAFGSRDELYNRCVKPFTPAPLGRESLKPLALASKSLLRGAEESRGVAASLFLVEGGQSYSLVLPLAHCVNASGLGRYGCDQSDGQVCRK